MSAPPPLVVGAEQIHAYLQSVSGLDATLRAAFAGLVDGVTVQPPQTVTMFPGAGGDFITYLGVLARERVFGVKVSPYLPTSGHPVITAWTLLMCMDTGLPLMLCDASALTRERTAGTTALAVDMLAAPSARTLAVIGTGSIAQAHLRRILPLRSWKSVRMTSRSLKQRNAEERAMLERLATGATLCDSVEEATHDADVVLLCTSSAVPVMDPTRLKRPALITSISTNAPGAHEVPPSALHDMDVYCDYAPTTPLQAGEMQLATQLHSWNPALLAGDLASLVAGRTPPDFTRHRFFRSIGLGIEDLAIAKHLFDHLKANA